jgi:hypothetical protein
MCVWVSNSSGMGVEGDEGGFLCECGGMLVRKSSQTDAGHKHEHVVLCRASVCEGSLTGPGHLPSLDETREHTHSCIVQHSCYGTAGQHKPEGRSCALPANLQHCAMSCCAV